MSSRGIMQPLAAAPVPIPTTYNGVQFRSRLEARWAVFFDTLEVKWFFEYEGYQLPCGWYLPDFWLPDLRTWIEIKPKDPSPEEADRCFELAIATGKRVHCFFGDLEAPELSTAMALAPERLSVPSGARAHRWDGDGTWDAFYLWCICPGCSRPGIAFDGRGERVCGPPCTIVCREYTLHHRMVMDAYEAARTARFYR